MAAIFILCCLCWIGSVGASHFFVTAPNVLRFNHDETILINTFGAGNNYQVEIWLKIKDQEFSRQIKTVQQESTPVTTTIKVTEEDLQIGDDGKTPPSVQLYAKTSQGTFSRKLLLSYDTGYILLQTSKPLYHPNEKVDVRALAMTESLKAAKGWNISMEIISPSNLTFGRSAKTDDSKFFQDSFALPPHAEVGLWTVRAFYAGQYRTEGRTNFQVRDYVLPTFGVTVDVIEKVITETTDNVTIEVTAKYVYKKPVKGSVVLKISCLAGDGTTNSLKDPLRTSLEADGSKRIELKKVDLDELKRECGSFASLEGQQLLVYVRVTEIASGKEEVASNKRTVFSSLKYRFNFDRSKETFRPGLSYYLRVSVKLASGDDPGVLNVTGTTDGASSLTTKTKEDGSALLIFPTQKNAGNFIRFTVEVAGSGEPPRDFVVNAYRGNNQIHVDQLRRDNGEMTIKNIIQGIGNTGIITLLLSRGQYIEHMYFQAGTDPERVMNVDIQKRVSPEARAVSFFIANDGTLVADSTKFQVEPKCRGKELKLETEQTKVFPDEKQDLTVTGSPNMGVGLNIMDQALLLLDSKNVLRKSKIFEMMKSHDWGCGEGGGTSAAEVFHDAGVTVVTNALLDSGSLERDSLECARHARNKRSIECADSGKQACCALGEKYAKAVLKEFSKREGDIDVWTKCYGQSMKIADLKEAGGDVRYSLACISAHFMKCVEVLKDGIEGKGLTTKSAHDDSNDYLDALKEFKIDGDIPVRKNFKESWLFMVVDLDDKGKTDISLRFPSTITDWMIQAVGITENDGPCIAEPTNVTAIKPVFIQLDMPYKTSRLEYFDLKVTVFNYKDKGNGAKFKLFLAPEKGLCIGASNMEQEKLIGDFSLDGNDAFSVRVPVLPLQAGRFPITVKLVGLVGQESLRDAIEKPLLVENEGIEERETITVCLQPFQSGENADCVDSDRVLSSEITEEIQTVTINMTLPANALVDTGSAFGYASSNLMDDVVRTILSGIDNMFIQPTGCAEQTASKLGPTVYVMSYWKATKQMTAQREQTGYTWIRNGVTHELTYRKGDGSYGSWYRGSRSRWLTAFVAKIFCQAKATVDNAVLDEHIEPTIRYLVDRIHHTNFQMKDHEEAAFMLITVLECDTRTINLSAAKRKIMTFLEGIPDITYQQNPAVLAMATYALALAKSEHSFKMKNMLLGIRNENNVKDFWYWGYPGGYPAYAYSIETTAYAMLALMQYNNGVSLVKPVVRWLTHQRSAAGSFRTTQDTVVGLQALTEYSIRTFSSSQVKLDISLTAEGMLTQRTQQLTNENAHLLETIKNIPVLQGERFLRVTAKGQGSGKLVIDYRYNRPKTDEEECAFDITDIDIKVVDGNFNYKSKTNFNRSCDVCECEMGNEKHDGNISVDIEATARMKRNADDGNPGEKKDYYCISFSVSSLNNRHHNMSIIDVGLETGMQVVKADLDKLLNDGLIDSYEMPDNDKGFFILYLAKISNEPMEFKFRLKEEFKVDKNNRQPSRIHVYDYYKPEFECITFYGTGPNGGSPVGYNCEDKLDSDSCSCLKSVCADEDKAGTLHASWKNDRKKFKPVAELYDDICIRRKATFAVLIEVTAVKTDHEKQIRIATATVRHLIHKGTDDIQNGTTIILYWRMFCSKTLLAAGRKYYILSTDGEKSVDTSNNVIYKYQIMGLSAVIVWTDISTLPAKFRDRTPEQSKLKSVQSMMKQFTRKMGKGCDQ